MQIFQRTADVSKIKKKVQGNITFISDFYFRKCDSFCQNVVISSDKKY